MGTSTEDGSRRKKKSLATRFSVPARKYCSCCKLSPKTITSLLSWTPKALFAAGGIFILLGSVLVGLGSMESVKYPAGLSVGIPLLVFGLGMMGLCIGVLVIRHKREARGIGIRTFDAYSKEVLNLSLNSSYSSAFSSPRAVQYYPSNTPNARSSIEAKPPEGLSVSAQKDPGYMRTMTGTPIIEEPEGTVMDTGTGFYYVADAANPSAGYYVHAETGDTYHVNEKTGAYCLVDADGRDTPMTSDTFSRRSSLSSYQNSTRPGSAAMSGRPSSGRPGSGSTTSSGSRIKKGKTPHIRPSSSVGRRQKGVNFVPVVSVSEISQTRSGQRVTSKYRQQLKEGKVPKTEVLQKLYNDPFGEGNSNARPKSGRPGTGRARSAMRRSIETDDDNIITADVHVHQGNNEDQVDNPKEVINRNMSPYQDPNVTKIYVQSDGKQLNKNKRGSDVDSSLGNSISSLPNGQSCTGNEDTRSVGSNLSDNMRNRIAENFQVRT